MRSAVALMAAAFAAALAAAPAARAGEVSFSEKPGADGSTYAEVPPERLLRMETSEGPVLIMMAPEFAPGHVARFSELAREGFFDGLKFHRVIDGFMAQGGDPTGTGGGGSKKPDLRAEFTARISLGEEAVEAGKRLMNPRDPDQGEAFQSYRDGYAIAHRASKASAGAGVLADPAIESWLIHCPGTVSTARTEDPHSANSQFFLMRGEAPWLDAQYTAWGRIVFGQNAVDTLAVGEPPASPSTLKRAVVMSDVAEKKRDRVWVMRADSVAFAAALAEAKAAAQAKGEARFNACSFAVPVVAEVQSAPVDEVDALFSKMRSPEN